MTVMWTLKKKQYKEVKMMKKGVYKDGKIHTSEFEIYDVERTMDWWPDANQEVKFELIGDKAIIKSLGKTLKPEDADKYIGSF